MPRLARRERGEGRFGAFLSLAILAVTIYLGFKVIPVMVNAYAFRDYLEEEARFAALRKKDEEILNRVLKKAEELNLPVKAKDIKINRSTTHFDMYVNYTIPIETPVYTYIWNFDEETRAPLF